MAWPCNRWPEPTDPSPTALGVPPSGAGGRQDGAIGGQHVAERPLGAAVAVGWGRRKPSAFGPKRNRPAGYLHAQRRCRAGRYGVPKRRRAGTDDAGGRTVMALGCRYASKVRGWRVNARPRSRKRISTYQILLDGEAGNIHGYGGQGRWCAEAKRANPRGNMRRTGCPENRRQWRWHRTRRRAHCRYHG